VSGARRTISPDMTLWEAFAVAMAAAPGSEALVARDGRATRSRLAREATSLSARFLAADAGPGENVLVLVPNSVRYPIALFAVSRTGATPVPLAPALTARELAAIVDAIGARIAVTGTAESEATVRAAFAENGREGSILRYGDRLEPSEPAEDAPAPLGRPATTDTAVLFFTSGTTGSPKAVAHSHRTLIASFLALERMHREFFEGPLPERIQRIATVTRRYGWRVLRAAARQVWMTALPFSAIGGHEVLFGALLGGHTLVTTPDFHSRRTMELLESKNVNVFAATPSMVESVLQLRDFDSFDLSTLLVVGIGGAPAAPDLVRRAQARFRCSVTVGYGSTELGGGILVTRIDDTDDVKRETVGRPFPGADVRIVDDQGNDVPPGTAGELICRTPSVMTGYSSATADGTTPVDEEGWYHTSDLAFRDEDGNVHITGRRDDLIIRGGNKIRPADVEQVLREVPGVRQAVVVGVDAARVGQQVWAFVVPESAEFPLDRAALLKHCQANLAPLKVPDHIRVCDSLPTTSLGKIQRHRLSQVAREEPHG